MDASTLKVAPTATIHVKNAAGEPLYDGDKKVQIVLHGPGSRVASQIEARQTARMLKRLNEADGKITAPTAEDKRTEAADDLAELTISFENLTYGEQTGTALYRSVYGDPDLGYITAQVTRAVKDWANFLPKSSET